MISYSKRSRDSRSRSPYMQDSRSVSRSLSRSMSRSRSRDSSDVENPGNNLYVTGLSPRITKKELEKHFSSEGGKVRDIHLVVDPRTRESRGFGFVTMSTVKEADSCVKYLNRSVLEGRVITVEKARRRRGRTPTPGKYLGLRTVRVHKRSPSYSPYRRSRYSSPHYSSDRHRDRSYSPYYSRYRDRSYSPYHSRYRYHSRSRSPYSRSPVGRRYRSNSASDSRSYSPYNRSISPYYMRRYRSISRSVSPKGRRSRRSYSLSPSPRPRRSMRRYSPSPLVRPRRSLRSYSPSPLPRPRRSLRSYSHSPTPSLEKCSRRSLSRSLGLQSRSVSRSRSWSPTPSSGSPSS